MERDVLQSIAMAKLEDAELLFRHDRHANAYYLFGYAAEVAIKVRIAGLFQPNTIPDRKFVQDVYSHDLNKLIGLAGLANELRRSREVSPEFDGYWSTVSDWSEASRYDVVGPFRATAMRRAMTDDGNGVFQWLQRHW